MLVFACFSPHPPIILPKIGSPSDRQKVKATITALESLAPKLAEAKPDIIITTSPHPDWGIEVPLYFLAKNLKFEVFNLQSILNFNLIKNFKLNLPAGKAGIKNSTEVFPILTTLDSPLKHYQWGQKIGKDLAGKLRVGWIASGDMSHVLKADGPYGFNPAGPKYDQKFIELLKNKEVKSILALDPELVEGAAECGLRSFCMLLGALEEEKVTWSPEILSYEGPFGVGYLVARLF